MGGALAKPTASQASARQSPGAALLAYERAREREPSNPEHHNNIGVALKALGRLDDAVAAYTRAIALDPRHAIAHHNLGNAFKLLGRQVEAAASYRRAIALRPDYAEALNSLGATLQELDQLAEAEASLRRAIALRPDYAEAHNHLGMVLQSAERVEEACAAYKHALALRPDYAEALSNLGFAYRRLDQLDAAEAQYGLALVHRPEFDVAAMNRGLVELARGAFAIGWADYLRRPVARAAAPLPAARLPADLTGSRILVLREQGLGDEIFFMRFVPMLKARGAWVALQVSDRLRPLVERALSLDALVDREAPANMTLRCYAGDLPFLLALDDSTSVQPTVSMTPLPNAVATMRQRLKALGEPPYVALTWRGGVKTAGKLYKDVPLAILAATLVEASGTLIALQRGLEPGEGERLATMLKRPVHDLGVSHDDLDEILAALSQCDDYVTVSNTYVHLRASLGRAARVLVPHPPEFRWLIEGERSPWFPDFPVYRQAVDGDWSSATAALRRDLAGANAKR